MTNFVNKCASLKYNQKRKIKATINFKKISGNVEDVEWSW